VREFDKGVFFIQFRATAFPLLFETSATFANPCDTKLIYWSISYQSNQEKKIKTKLSLESSQNPLFIFRQTFRNKQYFLFKL